MRNLIRKAPLWIKKPIKYVYGLIPYEKRLGKVFWDTYNFLQESQWWSKEQLEEYQMRELEKLLNHAYKNVPYYRRVFDERGLKPKDIQNFDDFKKIPYLTKDDVRENLNCLIARNITKEDMQYVTTGGTSGKPLGFYIEKRTNLIRDAFDWRQYNWAGYKFGDRCIVLRGNVVKRKENTETTWWEYNKDNNYLILSTYDMTEENLSKYVKKIEEFKPKVIKAYPSAIDILAKFVKENDLTINTKGNIKAISTSSENLYSTQKKLIKEVFKCPIFDLYGNCEQSARFGECEKHEGYHDYMEYSYTEILDKENKPVTKEGEIGEIISTAFTNYAVPFIRYKTEDLVEYNTHICSCGRQLPLIKRIYGRLQELIVTKDGRLVTLTAFLFARHLDWFSQVKQLQFVQKEKGQLLLKIVKKDKSCLNSKKIVDDLIKPVQGQVNINVSFVDKIPLTNRGKYKFLVQKLPIESLVQYE
jgi:phenylacetate-CoA ligase